KELRPPVADAPGSPTLPRFPAPLNHDPDREGRWCRKCFPRLRFGLRSTLPTTRIGVACLFLSAPISLFMAFDQNKSPLVFQLRGVLTMTASPFTPALGRWIHSLLPPRSWGQPTMRNRRHLMVENLEDRALPAPLAYDPVAQNALRDTLLAGVSQLTDMGSEGTITVFGDNAVSVVDDSDGKTVIAAADNGTTRVVAAAKTQFVEFANDSTFDTAQFYRNVLGWTSHGIGLQATIVTDKQEAQTWLTSNAYTNVVFRQDWENALDQADVLVTWLGDISPAQQAAATSFLDHGGGMFVGYNGWA